jgi:hypothetical protein
LGNSTEAGSDEAERDESASRPKARHRRTWEEMDALRARMVREGFPLAELTGAENWRVWQSLLTRRRRPQLQALLGMTEQQLEAATAQLRLQRQLVKERRSAPGNTWDYEGMIHR